jgi:diguanylate cyclase (GGDEF)-like protein
MTETPENRKIKILAADDNSEVLELLRAIVVMNGYLFEAASDGEEAIAKFDEFQPDLVILDYRMPKVDGASVLHHIRQSGSQVPVIFLSAVDDSSAVNGALDLGANDYVPKPFQPAELVSRMKAQLRSKELASRLSELNSKLSKMADTDEVTGLLNMRAILRLGEHALESARRYNRSMAAVMLDMDDFKKVNDEHGHVFGTYVLTHVAKVLRGLIRRSDLAARYGGDEFLIILTEVTPDGVQVFNERLCGALSQLVVEREGHSAIISISAGTAVLPPDVDMTIEGLIREADSALYKAKTSGKNQCLYTCREGEC